MFGNACSCRYLMPGAYGGRVLVSHIEAGHSAIDIIHLAGSFLGHMRASLIDCLCSFGALTWNQPPNAIFTARVT